MKTTLVFSLVLVASHSVALASTPFTIVALPDTQNYVTDPSDTLLFNQQTDWIADQVQIAGNPRNIQFVTHLGDVVSNGSSSTEWTRADAAMSTLDGVIPYSVLPGNHDYASTGNKPTGTTNYVSNFGPARFAGDSWFGGADPSGNNSYQRFSAGGYDFLHLALEWQPTVNLPFRPTSPIEWAQSIIDANPNTPVILSTHAYLDDDPAGRSSSGEALWNELVKRNDQIFMVLGGHYHSVGGFNDGEYHQVSTNDAGRPVIEVLQDYQDYPNGGEGWLRLIEFDIPANEIQFETYSPVLNAFQTERIDTVGGFASEFEIGIDFATRMVPVILPPLPEPDFILRNGENGYNGTLDKEIRSSGSDATNGQFDSISVDGDDGSPGNQPNQGLIRFDDVVNLVNAQLGQGDEIESATLVLEVVNPGSGFSVHEMLTGWDESTTWSQLVGGVDTNGSEAETAPIATFGSNDGNENVAIGKLEIDVTDTIREYLDGSRDNFGWALIPFASGTNGIDFLTSEYLGIDDRPTLEFFVSSDRLDGDYNRDGVVDAADYTVWRDTLNASVAQVYDGADGNGDGIVNAADYDVWRANFGQTAPVASKTGAPVPECDTFLLAIIAIVLVSVSRRF